MSTRRFFAYLAVACWLVLTPITLWTGQQWTQHATLVQVMSQSSDLTDGSNAKVVATFRIAEMRRQEFWREAAAWIALTIIGCALLAEHGPHAEHHAEILAADSRHGRALEHAAGHD